MRYLSSAAASLAVFVFCFTGVLQAAEPCPTDPTPGMTECSFNAFDFALIDPVEIEINTVCRAKTDHLYVFVEESLETGNLNVDKLIEAFETRSVAERDQGIYQQVTRIFGTPPDSFDDDEHIYLVIHDIRDTTLNPVSVYFREKDLAKNHYGEPLEGSNLHEVVFIDPQEMDSDLRLSDLTKTLVDMIHWSYDPDEVGWVVDVIGRQAALMMGYDSYKLDISRFAEDPDKPLIGKVVSERLNLDHGATTLFGVYINERFGEDFFFSWMMDSLSSIAGFEHTLPLAGDNTNNFCDYMHDWAVQNGVNRGDYRYETINLPRFSPRVIRQHPGESSPMLTPYSGSYVEIDVGGFDPENRLEVSYRVENTEGVRVSAVKIDYDRPTYLEIEELTVASGQTSYFTLDGAGEDFDKLTLISTRCTEAEPMSYFVSTSVIEPQIDGDEDDEIFEPEIEEEIDGDEELEEEIEEEPEEELESVIFGSWDCHEINACVVGCSDAACRESCVNQGTAKAQGEWEQYNICINGHNPDGIDCLSLATAKERENCMIRNCHIEVEKCEVIEEVIDDGDDIGGSNCRHGGPISGLFLSLILLAVAMQRRKHA